MAKTKTPKIGSRGRPFRSYEEALAVVTGTKQRRENGYALDSTGYRAHLDGDEIVISKGRRERPCAVLHPDNTVSLFPALTGQKTAAMFGNQPHEFVGLHAFRKGKGAYVMIHQRVVDAQPEISYQVPTTWNPTTRTYDGIEIKTMQPWPWTLWGGHYYKDPDGKPIPTQKHLFWDLYDGVRVSLSTGEPLVRQTVKRKVTSSAAATAWKRKVTKAKCVFRMRVKLDGGRTWERVQPSWYARSAVTADALWSAIDACEFGPELQELIIQHAKRWQYATQPNRYTGEPAQMTIEDACVKAFDSIYAMHRDTLRQRAEVLEFVTTRQRAA